MEGQGDEHADKKTVSPEPDPPQTECKADGQVSAWIANISEYKKDLFKDNVETLLNAVQQFRRLLSIGIYSA
jgi:hypothetical protein